MAIVFLQQKKIQKSMIFVFVFILLIILVVIWRGFFHKEKPLVEGEIISAPEKKIEIDFKVFDHPLLGKLQPYFQIRPFEEIAPVDEAQIGRENPFLPY